MTGLLQELNHQREQQLANQNRRRALESAAAALANMRVQVEQIEALVEDTKGADGLHASAKKVLAQVRADYRDTLAIYEAAKADAERSKIPPILAPVVKVIGESSVDTEMEEARANDQKLLDELLSELQKHALETGIQETPLQVLRRIADDHTRFVTGNGQFSPALLDRLFINRNPGEYNVEATVSRLLAENIDLRSKLAA